MLPSASWDVQSSLGAFGTVLVLWACILICVTTIVGVLQRVGVNVDAYSLIGVRNTFTGIIPASCTFAEGSLRA